MLKYFGIAVVVTVIALLVIVSVRPATYHVERSVVIAATPEKINTLIDDFHNWSQWSPWAHLDPAMKESYSGALAGQGAVYEWQGNSKVGKGRMEIVVSQPTETSIALEFMSPWKSSNSTNFILEPEGRFTRVTWTMDGSNNFVGELMSVFVSMDKTIGKDFENGLTSLKVAAEK